MKTKIAAFFIGALLATTTTWALTTTRTETRLEDVRILIIKQPGDPSFLVSYRTFDDQGLLRDMANEDYWPELTATQKNQIRAIVDGVYVKLHNQQQIPLPSPTPSEPLPSPSADTKD